VLTRVTLLCDAFSGRSLQGFFDLIIGLDLLSPAPIHSQRDSQFVGLRADGSFCPANLGSDLGCRVFLRHVQQLPHLIVCPRSSCCLGHHCSSWTRDHGTSREWKGLSKNGQVLSLRDKPETCGYRWLSPGCFLDIGGTDTALGGSGTPACGLSRHEGLGPLPGDGEMNRVTLYGTYFRADRSRDFLI
jgi:hypothetical protein